MGPPGTGVGTCMRLVAPVLLVSIHLSGHSVDPDISVQVCDSKGNATGYGVWKDRRSGELSSLFTLEIRDAGRVDSR